jgi:divalent metal cation (Fe/Co/Zn/Cd) transporter
MLFAGAFGELTDRGVSPRTQRILIRALNPLLPPSPSASTEAPHPNSRQIPSPSTLLGIHDLRAMRAGATMFVDVIADVSPAMTMGDAVVIEKDITEKLKAVRREISEVRVKFNTIEKETNGAVH